MMQACLLTLTSAPALEESLVDWLLARVDISGFSSSHILGHGSHESSMSFAEQVLGRQTRVQFTVHTEVEIAKRMIDNLNSRFPDTHLHYCIIPVLQFGTVGE